MWLVGMLRLTPDPVPQPFRVRGCILTLVERMDEEFTKIMQNTDPHSQGERGAWGEGPGLRVGSRTPGGDAGVPRTPGGGMGVVHNPVRGCGGPVSPPASP